MHHDPTPGERAMRAYLAELDRRIAALPAEGATLPEAVQRARLLGGRAGVEAALRALTPDLCHHHDND